MKDQSQNELILIYNADKGFINGLMDSVHKLVSPGTYACDLCAITHGVAGPKRQWATFLKEINMPVLFYHKDDMPKAFAKFELPVILLKTEDGIQTIMNKGDLSKNQEVDDLIGILRIKMNEK